MRTTKHILPLAAIALSASAHAAIVANGSLTDSSQIRTATNNPFFTTPGQTDLVGVNFHYSGGNVNFQSTPDVPAGTVNGVAFDNIDMWNGNTSTAPAAGPHALSANGAGPTLTVTSSATYNDVRNQTTTIAGTDGANLQAVADEFYYFGTSDSRSPLTLSFANLGVAEGEALYVQLIGGAIFGNGANINVSANGDSIGAWSVNTTTDEADLFGFDTVAGAGGSLELGLSGGNFPGISGVIISTQIPEPSSVGLLSLGVLGVILRRRRR